MKILHVINFFKPSWESGGPARVAYGFSKKLIARGHEVTVYTTDGFKSKLDVEKNKPVDVDGIKTYYFKNLSSYLVRRMILPIPFYSPIIAKREIKNFDIIHIHEYGTLLSVIVHHYAKKHGIPYIFQAHGSLPNINEKMSLKKLYNIFYGYKILKNASKVIALTKTEVKQYKKIGVDENKIEIVPNGIDFSEYSKLPNKGKFREKYSIRDDEKMILYLGRIHQIKGIDLLVEAFADLTKELDTVRLVVVGPDDGYLSTLKKQINDLGVSDKILFTGPLYNKRDKLEAYVDADVYVLSSIYETFPVTVLEAWACGVPVIVTDKCSIANIIDKVGCVVEFDKDQLRDGITKILCDEDLRRRFGEGGRRLVKEQFDLDGVVGRLEQIYEDILP